MTDLEALKAMLECAGIEYEEAVKTITITRGYAGFYVSVEFDADGNLKDIGGYE